MADGAAFIRREADLFLQQDHHFRQRRGRADEAVALRIPEEAVGFEARLDAADVVVARRKARDVLRVRVATGGRRQTLLSW